MRIAFNECGQVRPPPSCNRHHRHRDSGLVLLPPVLAVLFGLVGVTAVLGWIDIVLLPALAFFIGLTIYAVWRRQRNH